MRSTRSRPPCFAATSGDWQKSRTGKTTPKTARKRIQPAQRQACFAGSTHSPQCLRNARAGKRSAQANATPLTGKFARDRPGTHSARGALCLLQPQRAQQRAAPMRGPHLLLQQHKQPPEVVAFLRTWRGGLWVLAKQRQRPPENAFSPPVFAHPKKTVFGFLAPWRRAQQHGPQASAPPGHTSRGKGSKGHGRGGRGVHPRTEATDRATDSPTGVARHSPTFNSAPPICRAASGPNAQWTKPQDTAPTHERGRGDLPAAKRALGRRGTGGDHAHEKGQRKDSVCQGGPTHR